MNRGSAHNEPGLGRFAVGLLISAVILVPFFLQMHTFGILTSARGSEAFYNASIGILGALVIAIALQIRAAVDALLRLFGRGDYPLLVPMLFGYLATLISGGAAALSALQNCSSSGICGSPDDMNTVIFALISGAAFLVAVFTASVYHRLTELDQRDQVDRGTPPK